MRTFIPHKFLSLFLLVTMLIVSINGMHNHAHAGQGDVTASCKNDLHSEVPQSPTVPLEEHKDSDGCDSCENCACHAPLICQPFQLSYNPVILDLSTSEPFIHLLEVHLPKFIPPQNQA
jgi:hypothetical protein